MKRSEIDKKKTTMTSRNYCTGREHSEMTGILKFGVLASEI
jgi:hypothetical protein